MLLSRRALVNACGECLQGGWAFGIALAQDSQRWTVIHLRRRTAPAGVQEIAHYGYGWHGESGTRHYADDNQTVNSMKSGQ